MRAWNKTDSSILVILLLAAVALGWYYPSIPSEVPSHYGLNGKVDAFSPKVFLWEIYGILVSLQLILYFVGKTNPRFYNYPFKIREENRERPPSNRPPSQRAKDIHFTPLLIDYWVFSIFDGEDTNLVPFSDSPRANPPHHKGDHPHLQSKQTELGHPF